MEDRPYLPAKTAWAFEELLGPYGIPEGTFRQLSMKFCSLSSIKRSSHENKAFSVAIFSPGLGDSRLIHAARARSLASLGYVVATVDHTYEANVVEFPDGTVIYGLSFDENGPAVIAKLLEVRTADESFLLDQLSSSTISDALLADFPGQMDANQVMVYGHSLGGATATLTNQREPRAIGGMDFDGALPSNDLTQTLSKSFALIASAKNAGSPALQWDDFYAKLAGAKLQVAIARTAHYGFTDLPLLLTVCDLSVEGRVKIAEVVGTLDGRIFETALNGLVDGFLKLVFKHHVAPLRRAMDDGDVQFFHDALPQCQSMRKEEMAACLKSQLIF